MTVNRGVPFHAVEREKQAATVKPYSAVNVGIVQTIAATVGR